MQPEANKKHSRVNKKFKKKKITGWRVSTFIPVHSLLGGIIIPLLVSGGGGEWGGERTAMLFVKWIAPLTAFHSSGFSKVQ